MEENKVTEKLVIDDTGYETKLTKKYKTKKPYAPPSKTMIYSFIPGVIREIMVKPGDQIEHGTSVLKLEAMKMVNTVASHLEGKVKKIHVKPGQMVRKNELLIELE